MYKDMTHFLYHAPWCFGVVTLKLFCKFVNGFTYNLYIIYTCMKPQLIRREHLLAQSFCKRFHITNGLKRMLKSVFVSSLLSHK